MPTTLTAQSGVVIKQATQIAVAGCTGGKGKTRIKILGKRIVHGKLVLRVQTFAAGRVSVKSGDLRNDLPQVQEGRQVHDQGAALAQGRERTARAPAAVQAARRLPAGVEGGIALDRVHEHRLRRQVEAQAQALTHGRTGR